MDTRRAHAHIWKAIRPFQGKSVVYAFRFDNGRTKFGKTTNIRSRTRDHLANGITGCVAVTVVVVNPFCLDSAERDVLTHVASRYTKVTSEVFESSPSAAHDEQLIREAIGPQVLELRTSEALAGSHAAWRAQHDADIDRLRAEGRLRRRPPRTRSAPSEVPTATGRAEQYAPVRATGSIAPLSHAEKLAYLASIKREPQPGQQPRQPAIGLFERVLRFLARAQASR